jgi:hypothetical protein
MPKAPYSKVEKLKAAGLIKPKKRLTAQQTEAIESLSSKQVDQLISLNKQLEEAVTSDDPVLIMPGRIASKPGKPPSKP